MFGHWLLSFIPFWLTFDSLHGFFASFSPSAATTHCYARVETNSETGVARLLASPPGSGDHFNPHKTSLGDLGLSVHPNLTCIRVTDGKIKEIFDGKSAIRFDGRGYAFPAFWDGHGHVLQYGEMLQSVKLYGAGSIDEVKERIKKYLRTHSGYGTKDKWIRGIGWDQANFDGRMPTAKEFEQDPELRGLYIMVDRIDAHCTWVSESVLALLPNPLPYVPGGEITTDPGPGVFCDNAMDLPLGPWPQPTRVDKLEFIQQAMKSLHSAGIAGVHDAGVIPEDMELYDWMADAGLLTLRIYGMYECPARNTFCGNITRMIERKDGMLTARSVKLFADGALGSWGAAMLEPYTDKPAVSGTMLIEENALVEVVEQWYAADYQVNIHAIGDRAARAALTAFHTVLYSSCPAPDYISSPSHLSATLKACISSTQKSLRRLRLEHSQIIHPEDQRLMAQLGIIASIQPTHATSDMAYALDRLGEERLQERAYRMHSFLDMNVPLILGSDFPVEPPGVLAGGIYAAVSRQDPNTPFMNGSGWYGEESLELADAVNGFTTGPARGAFMEGKGAGELKVGGWADWVVLDMDIGGLDVKADPEALKKVKVLETWVAGKRVYCRECEEEVLVWWAWWRNVKAWKGWWGWGLRVEKVMGEVEKVLGQHGL